MLSIFPDYYHKFRCTASRCLHNCCIGWEIDIDENTASFYNSVSGDMGKRLRESIASEDDVSHFILKEGERCPFLNSQNLCDIIISLGEEHLCTICREHPRFHNQLPGRVESGLGMCCEEAARLILSETSPVEFLTEGTAECEDEIVALRDEVIKKLQDRSKTIDERIGDMLTACDASLPERTCSQWADFLSGLERLQDSWTDMLTLLNDKGDTADLAAFDAHMQNRQTEYEQLLIYIVYRHMANAPDFDEVAPRVAFAALCYRLLHTLGAVIYNEKGDFTFEQQLGLCRMLSSEIEYSDENLYALLTELY
ncbi:MAG: flagellin lysine-N-methylase [Clostridia bacterium]|nr:flagellin lysine-N-methylase [Clostridia bacterium]